MSTHASFKKILAVSLTAIIVFTSLAVLAYPHEALAAPTCTDPGYTINPTSGRCTSAAGENDTCTAGGTFVPTLNSDGTAQGGQCEKAAGDDGKVAPATCDFWKGYTFNGCFWYPAVAKISELLISLGAFFLSMGALVFNAFVQYSIINFGTSFAPVLDSINRAWEYFRNLGNLIIIGMLLFVAYNIILGRQNFGAKKMVARVLVAAVLINFSLLITKLVIDASNFTATQLYETLTVIPKADPATSPPTSTLSNSSPTTPTNDVRVANPQSDGLAGRFLGMLGVSGTADTYGIMEEIAKKNNSGWLALMHGMFTFFILTGAGVVFFYGAILLAIRILSFILVLTTSGLIFAASLFSGSAGVSKLWETWWNQLLKNAVFAPLLMLFLAATLTIGEGFNSVKSGGTLGRLISEPTNASNIGALFNYFIVLGLLYMSFRLANSFSISIANVNINEKATQAFNMARGYAGRFGRFAQGDVAQQWRNDPYRAQIGQGIRSFGASIADSYRNRNAPPRPARSPSSAPIRANVPGVVFGKPKVAPQNVGQAAQTRAPGTTAAAKAEVPAPSAAPQIQKAPPQIPQVEKIDVPTAQGVKNATMGLATQEESAKIQRVKDEVIERSAEVRQTESLKSNVTPISSHPRYRNMFAKNDNQPSGPTPSAPAARPTIEQGPTTAVAQSFPRRQEPSSRPAPRPSEPQRNPNFNPPPNAA